MNKYSLYSDEQIEELFSLFLIDSWSYSKTATFTRNEKEFERTYIYRERSKRSATTVAGNAYHKAMEFFFNKISDGELISIIEMEREAFAYIEQVPADSWRLQKTTPSIEECVIKANKTASSLVYNFMAEKDTYTQNIKRVLGVELRCEEWLVVNGVDIPLPCHAEIDLIIETTDGKIVVIDHKSKKSFTEESEIAMVIGKQAITYVKCIESKFSNIKVDEVWFIENKPSKNKDGSPQMKKNRVMMDNNARRLYEVMLYEPLKRMIDAVYDPDYVYTLNDSDSLSDKAELYIFWAKTMIAEVEDFNVPDSKKELVRQRLKKIRDASISTINPKLIREFKKNASAFIEYDFSNKDMSKSEKIEHVLRTFGLIVKVEKEINGYSSDTFLLEVSAGVKISNIMKYKLDIANALNVSSVRIGKDLMVYNGKSYLFIETPKKRTETLLWDKKYLVEEKIPIGIDNFGRTIHWDLNNHSTPHVLICGATGSGKSVSIISTVEYAKVAGITDIVIFDPKYEFCSYSSQGVRVYNEIEDIEEQMKLLVEDMQSRAKNGIKSKTLVIFDEFADAVSASKSGTELDIKEKVQIGYYAPKKMMGIPMPPEPKYEMRVVGRHKSLEENLKILLQKGRSLGFRIVAATQRASVNVITGDAKVNFPVQICFRVPKEIDSKVVLDEPGAETLAGMGDGLMKSPEYINVVRFQGFYKA